MAATITKKAWYDKAFITIHPDGGSAVNVYANTTNLGISGGGFDIEGIDTFGGKVTRVGTKDDIEISLDGIPASSKDFDWAFHGLASNTSESITSWTERKFRVTFLWTDQTGVTSAEQAITGSYQAYRKIYAEAYCTSIENSMDAGEQLTSTLIFKLPYEDETSGQNFKIEIKGTESGTLSATPDYTAGTGKY